MSDSAAVSSYGFDAPSHRLATDFYRSVYCILGLPFDAITLDGVAHKVRQMAAQRSQACLLSTPNVNFAIGSRRHRDLRDSVLRSDLSIIDGMPLLWIARLLGLPFEERVAGSDLFERLRQPSNLPTSVFFFGGDDGVAERACQSLNATASGLRCNGYFAPGRGSVEDMSSPAIINAINDSEADFVVVALGARKGQNWIVRNFTALDASVVCHLGAVINFVAGRVKRAPGILQKIGLEWIWRIKEEPGLWRRYAGDGIALLSLSAIRILPAIALRARTGQHVGERLVQVVRNHGVCTIRMAGAWTTSDIEPLRSALTDATSARMPVVLDADAVTSVDSATIALILLLKGHQLKVDEQFTYRSTSRVVARQLYQMGAEHLYDEA